MRVHAAAERGRAQSETKIRCLLAHEHVLLRQGVRRLLEDAPDLDIVAEAGSALEAAAMILEHRPDVVIADTGLFGLSGDQLETVILRESPRSRVLLLANHADKGAHHEPHSGQSHQATHKTSAEELLEMVRKTHTAEMAPVEEMPRRGTAPGWPSEEVLPRKRALTARENEVLKLLAEGRTVRSAAKVLGLSVKTVDAHKFNLMRKLGLHNKTELLLWAIQKKVVKLPANF